MNERTNTPGALRVSKIERRASTLRHRLSGVFEGTHLATRSGWQTVDSLNPGDAVWTFDDGLQPILEIDRKVLWSREADRKRVPSPVLIPAGALANEDELFMLPAQGLLLECENACDPFGEPYAVVPISSLQGLCGIETQMPENGIELYSLKFAKEQAIYIDGGLLLHVPQSTSPEPDAAMPSRYDVKTIKDAKTLLTDLDLAELALRESYEEFFGAMGMVSHA